MAAERDRHPDEGGAEMRERPWERFQDAQPYQPLAPLPLSGAVLTWAQGGAAGVCAADLPAQMPALEGHYPGLPLVPGVLLVEVVAGAEAARRGLPRLGDAWAGVRSARFRLPVAPGERLLLERKGGGPGAPRDPGASQGPGGSQGSGAPQGPGSRQPPEVPRGPGASWQPVTRLDDGPRWTVRRGDGVDGAVVAVVDLLLDEERAGSQAGPGGHGSNGPQGLPVNPAQVIPHRPPMLLVDAVASVRSGREATVLWAETGRASRATAGQAAQAVGPAASVEAGPAAGLEAGSAASAAADLTRRPAGSASPPGGVPVPWPLVLESWLQAAVLLAVWDRPCPDVRTGGAPLLGGVRDVRFGAQPLPGSVLEHRVAMVSSRGGAYSLSGSTWAEGAQVLTVGRADLGLRPPEALP